jgi:hypothetical protein
MAVLKKGCQFFAFVLFELGVVFLVGIGLRLGHFNQQLIAVISSYLCSLFWERVAHFRFCVSRIQHESFRLCFKFHQNRTINSWIQELQGFTRWRRRPSWKMAAHFRFRVFRTQRAVLSLYTNFHRDRAIIGLRTRLRSPYQPKHAKLRVLNGYFWG